MPTICDGLSATMHQPSGLVFDINCWDLRGGCPYKSGQAGVYDYGMQGKLCLYSGSAFAALFLIIVTLFLIGVPVRQPRMLTDLADNNPQKFHLWSTGSNFSCTFTCDPHASDVWMFRTAEGTMLVLPARSDQFPISTNPQIGP